MASNLEIQWKKFTEEEIQTLLAMLFHTIDYSVDELHKSDRANECGADLVVKKGNESTAIAVKIKPDTKDRPQLIDLSKRQEKKKLYVYIETPTKKFLDFTKEQHDVEFWDMNKLNDFFITKNIYFSANIIFDNHPINDEITLIRYILSQLWKRSHNAKKQKIRPINKESFFVLWRLKDMAVTLHQTNKLIERLFETPINNKNQELNVHFLNIFLDYLTVLEAKISEFLTFFVLFYEKNEELVNNSIVEQHSRSHWLWIAHYQPLNNLRTLREELKDAIRDKKLYADLAKDLENVPEDKELKKYEEEIAKGNDIWQAIHKKLRDLMIFGSGVEEIVDDVVKEYFNDYSILNGMKQFEVFR